jgi:Uma2 family endonuclease
MSEAQTSPGPYTWDDFVALDEDDRRELIDGELVEVEVPTELHEYIVWILSTTSPRGRSREEPASGSPRGSRSASPIDGA